MLQLCFSLSILVITHLGILEGSRYIHILLYSLFNSIFQWNINIVIKDYSDHVVTTAQHLPNQSSVLMRIWLGILCFNTVNQWEIMTQSSCKARGNRKINSKKVSGQLSSIQLVSSYIISPWQWHDSPTFKYSNNFQNSPVMFPCIPIYDYWWVNN